MMFRDWMEHAVCADGSNPDAWFPDQPGVPGQRQAQAAAAVCRTCPVIGQCRAYAKEIGATHGVWGATMQIGRALRDTRPPISHGTPGGYRTHLRRGERACESCRVARNVDAADRRHSRNVRPVASVGAFRKGHGGGEK